MIKNAVWLILILFLSLQNSYGQKKIEILHADVLEFDEKLIDAHRLKGNVKFLHDNVYLDCDSAWFFRRENLVKAFGHIYMRQSDTVNLWGDYLEYDGDRKIALVQKDVRMTDRTMNLRTEAIRYDMNEKVGYYNTGGEITNAENKLTSEIGRYFSRTKEFHFRKNVKLVNPEYTMTCDTLKYNTASKTAFFLGPTYIRSQENLIFCNYGWYNTQTNLSKGA